MNQKITSILAKLQDFYEKRYVLLLIISLLMACFFAGVLIHHKATTGEFVSKDASLKGGLLITIATEKPLDISATEAKLADSLNSPVSIKTLTSIGAGGVVGYTFELATGLDKDKVLSAISSATGLTLSEGAYTIEEISPSLGASFWKSTIKAIAVAFIIMSIVVFLYFRKLIPSIMVISAAAIDIGGAMAMMDLLKIPLSSAGVAAFLMLIGYSVDTDVLLTAKVLKQRTGSVLDSVKQSIKTGLTMQLTTIAALTAMVIISPSQVIKQIALILLMGVAIDIPSTWFGNAGMIRLYVEKTEKNGAK